MDSIVQRLKNVSQYYGHFCFDEHVSCEPPLKLCFCQTSPLNVIFTRLSSSFFVESHAVEIGEWKGLWILQSTMGTSDRKMPMHIQKPMSCKDLPIPTKVNGWMYMVYTWLLECGFLEWLHEQHIEGLQIYVVFPGVVHNIWKCRPGSSDPRDGSPVADYIG